MSQGNAAVSDDAMTPMQTELMKLTLQAAVPLWVERLKHKSMSEILARARVCGEVVAEKGDIIQFKSKKKGATADAFNHLAEGLACLAFAPGGVTFLGLKFEYHRLKRGRK
jgi:hypothetical protein